ncbi:alpha/beta fold hydrolase [Halobacillus sp. A1]|uniref:alpha/beta hydrolase n=1 Tax=Halobacillus sp. A1 TaxID=2880262 RepID=UPI0020A657F2|nr:alpha/beta fold hydrolase [Halobacillus sp. A1]MCP3030586.1 alpha/beta fold hydrolase [Halobacillus sp. A1]
MTVHQVQKGAEEVFYEGNEIGILVCHGFTGTTQSMKPLVEAYAREGYSIAAPRLKGHGTSPEEMEETTYHDWIHSVEDAFQWLEKRCSKVFAVGLSMGGTLALSMAARYDKIAGVVPINAAIDIPAMENIVEQTDDRYIAAIGSDIKKEGVEELAYQRTPVRSIQNLLTLMTEVHDQLAKIHCPIFIFVSEEDHVVPPENSEMVFETVLSEHKELIHLDNSYHVATLDNDQDIIIERSLEFFVMYSNAK